jgi:ribose transport system substrate-binding protein
MINKAQIPTITIDRTLNASPGEGYYKAQIVQDFVEVGRLAANRAVEMLTEKYGEPKGNILEITGTIGASASVDQGKGIKEVLENYPDIKIVDSQPGDYNRAVARSVMDDFLNKYPEDSIDVLICYCDDSALGSLQAMRDANRTDLLGKIIAKDGLKDAIKEVIDGNIDVTYQCPPYFGEVTMDLIDKILNDGTYETTIDVPFKTFDMRENKNMTEEYYQYLLDNNLDY